MEEDVGAKAPVTRLRRRLSVEQSEEVKSPSAPSTPSKKRGGRLAAKPQLELIDENSSENTPKRQTKKSATKDVIEASEEKVLTPARRSTRIKSNTSIVSDTPQSFDSPRAKRAARRTSQIGSDNEAPQTPVRQTRRTRKDSTSSIDKQENTSSAKKTTIIADSIIEEVETNSQKSLENEKSETTPKRKSPRSQKKKKQGDVDNESEDIQQKNNNTPDTNKKSKIKISDDSFQLINSMDDRPLNKTQLNNSASSVNSRKTRRNRTNTWTADQNENSDVKKQNNVEVKVEADDNESNFAENKDKQDSSNNKINDEIQENNDLINTSKSKKKRNSISSNNSKLDQLDKSSTDKLNLNKTNDTMKSASAVSNETEKLFEKPPVNTVQSLIYFDDSDSDSRGKPASDKPGDSEDQCVPVVPEINQKSVHDSILKQNENASDKVSYNDTCEPMDIDETMPTNVSLLNSSNSNEDKDTNDILEKSKELKNSVENIKSPNKSKRESTSSLSISQNNDNPGNENKSTLILSQLKDVSTTDNSLTKSPKPTQLKDISTNDNSLTKSAAVEVLSKSVTKIENDRETDKKDSLTYMTSTPLQQKNLKKMAIQINTSVISNSNNGSIQKSPANKNKRNDSKQSNRSAEMSSAEESDSENVSTKDKSDFLDDEAEEASNDYESGDSQDEEEKQYAEENEILEKGETLDSDDDGSNDTDYEKDSFVASSDDEDNELLSGSGDDLSMSDNELKMTEKSKNKFNERKSKEQKKASREMYEARHNLSNNSSKAEITKQKKNNRLRLNSSTLQSEEEIAVKSKKNKRMKIDYSQDSSTENEGEVDSKETDTNVSMAKEHEITSVCDESVTHKNDPLSMNVKLEPQTPLKDLDMSTVPILDKIEEVQMDQNVTIMKSNETSDPLQDDSDASSISENMEIASNYDSVLKELNKEVQNKKIKSFDTSLNLNKKTKQSVNNTIVDTLNLTNTKKSKHNIDMPAHSNTSQKLNSSSSHTKTKGEFNESSSDSIDLQLLFSEDSSDSIKKASDKKQDEQNEPEKYIPLKRTEAKTNIPEENAEETFKNQLNTNIKIHKKKNSLSMSEDMHNNSLNPEVSLNSLFDTSSKKKKNSISHDEIDLNVSQKVSNENTSSNTTLNNSSKKKKKNSLSINDDNARNNQLEEALQNHTANDISMNSTLNTSTKKKKKKNSISAGDEASVSKMSTNDDPKISLDKIGANQSINTSIKNDETSNAKDAYENDHKVSLDEIDPNQSINTSIKKKKNKNSISLGDETSDVNDASNKYQNISQSENYPNQSVDTSSKKKKKNKNSISLGDETSDVNDASNKYQNISQSENYPNQSVDTSSKKKKKNSMSINYESESAANIDIASNQNVSVVTQMDHNMSLNNILNSSSKKKKKNSIPVVENQEMDVKNNISVTNKVSDISLKKSSLDQSINSALNTSTKKKNSLYSEVGSEVNTAQNDSNVLDKSSNAQMSSAKKKRKHNDSVVANLNLSSASANEKVNDSLNSSTKKKKNNKADLQDIEKESQDGDSDAPEEIPYASHKNVSAADTSDAVHIFIDTEGNQDWNTLITSGSSKKKNKKKNEVHETPSAVDAVVETEKEKTGNTNKRKRKSSANSSYQEAVSEDLDQKPLNDSASVENKRKKQKTSQSVDELSTDIKDSNKKQNKKRKERDDDDPIVTSKVFKQNSSDKLSVPRLPSTILNQLEDKPKKEMLQKKKAKVVSTTQFNVEEAQKRKNKPSNYLEESVYLNDSVDEKKQKGFIKVPKVLPFVPTATISGSGFTTKFQINVLAKETKFVAQTSNEAGFKNQYLSSKKIKKARTYEMYKSQRNRKMSKF